MTPESADSVVLCGISQSFDWLSHALRKITHVLLTRAPLGIATSFDLHVLGTPPAFVLSQNQTLQFKFCTQQIADFLYVTGIIVLLVCFLKKIILWTEFYFGEAEVRNSPRTQKPLI